MHVHFNRCNCVLCFVTVTCVPPLPPYLCTSVILFIILSLFADTMPRTDKHARSKRGGRAVPYASGFRPKTPKARLNAMCIHQEKVDELGKEYQPSEGFFSKVPTCTSVDDWLAQYNEEGQSYSQFLLECPWLSNRKRKYIKQTFVPSGRNLPQKYPSGVIYILPLGRFGDSVDATSCSPDISAIVDYTERFLCLPVKQLPAVSVEANGKEVIWTRAGEVPLKVQTVSLKSRYNAKNKQTQLQVDAGLCQIRNHYVPNDALCVMAVTMLDLYQDPSDLFVAGMAAGNQRAGIFSLRRYDPNLTFSTEHWYDIQYTPQYGPRERRALMLQRSCRLVVHEIGHLLGLDHCVYYSCCMNGSGHLAEDFRQPMMLCPVDLRKLQTLCGFSVVARYRGLLEFFKKHGMGEEANWVEKRLNFLDGWRESSALTVILLYNILFVQ